MLKDLKLGQTIYDIEFRKVRWYTYFCVHPTNPRYHILLNEGGDPIKMFDDILASILLQEFTTRKEAMLELANRLEEDAKDIRENFTKES